MSQIAEQFDAAMKGLYERTLSATNKQYKPSIFNRMVMEKGGEMTAKDLLESQEPQYGLGKLWEYDCLELSVEFLALQPKFTTLFTDRELSEAGKRLADYGMSVDPDGNLVALDK